MNKWQYRKIYYETYDYPKYIWCKLSKLYLETDSSDYYTYINNGCFCLADEIKSEMEN